MIRLFIIFIICLSLIFVTCPSPSPSADLILYNGNILTLDDKMPVVQALAAEKGNILARGDSQKIKAMAGPSARVIDLKGMTAVPGFGQCFFPVHLRCWP